MWSGWFFQAWSHYNRQTVHCLHVNIYYMIICVTPSLPLALPPYLSPSLSPSPITCWLAPLDTPLHHWMLLYQTHPQPGCHRHRKWNHLQTQKLSSINTYMYNISRFLHIVIHVGTYLYMYLCKVANVLKVYIIQQGQRSLIEVGGGIAY